VASHCIPQGAGQGNHSLTRDSAHVCQPLNQCQLRNSRDKEMQMAQVQKREDLRGILSDIRNKANQRISHLEDIHENNLAWLSDLVSSNNAILTRAVSSQPGPGSKGNSGITLGAGVDSNALHQPTSRASLVVLAGAPSTTSSVPIGVKRTSSDKVSMSEMNPADKENFAVPAPTAAAAAPASAVAMTTRIENQPASPKAPAVAASAKAVATAAATVAAAIAEHEAPARASEKRVRLSDENKPPSLLNSSNAAPMNVNTENAGADSSLDESGFTDKPTILKVPLPPPTPCREMQVAKPASQQPVKSPLPTVKEAAASKQGAHEDNEASQEKPMEAAPRTPSNPTGATAQSLQAAPAVESNVTPILPKPNALAPLPIPSTPTANGIGSLSVLNALSPIRAAANGTKITGNIQSHATPGRPEEDSMYLALVNSPIIGQQTGVQEAAATIMSTIPQNGAVPPVISAQPAPADLKKPVFHMAANEPDNSIEEDMQALKPKPALRTSLDSEGNAGFEDAKAIPDPQPRGDEVEQPTRQITESITQTTKLGNAIELIAKHRLEQQMLEEQAKATGSSSTAASTTAAAPAPREKPLSLFDRLRNLLPGFHSTTSAAPAQPTTAAPAAPAASAPTATEASTQNTTQMATDATASFTQTTTEQAKTTGATTMQSSLRARVEEAKGRLGQTRTVPEVPQPTAAAAAAAPIRATATAQSASVLSTSQAASAAGVPVIRGGQKQGTSATTVPAPTSEAAAKPVVIQAGSSTASAKSAEAMPAPDISLVKSAGANTSFNADRSPASNGSKARRSNPTAKPPEQPAQAAPKQPAVATPATAKTASAIATPNAPAHETYARALNRLINMRTPPVRREDTYELTDHEYDNSDDEFDRNDPLRQHKIPEWARDMKKVVKMHMMQLTADPDIIFPPLEVKSCDLNAIFSGFKERPRFRKRTSSAYWANDRLTKQEIIAANKALGIITPTPTSTPAKRV